MLNIINSATLWCRRSLSGFEHFLALAKGGRRGITQCIAYQCEGSFALQVGVPI